VLTVNISLDDEVDDVPIEDEVLSCECLNELEVVGEDYLLC